MKILFWLLLILLTLLGFTLFIGFDPGYVLFVYDKWSVEMPLWLLLAGTVLVYFCIRFFVYFFHIPSRLFFFARKHREKSAWKYFLKGMHAFYLGENKKAHQAFLKSAKYFYHPKLAYLQAATVASQQHDDEALNADLILAKACKSYRNENLLIDIATAQFLYEQHQYTEALEILQNCDQIYPLQPKILFLLHKIYLIKGEWKKLCQLLPHLQKLDFFTHEQFSLLEKNIYQGLLKENFQQENAFREAWELIPRQHKKDPQLFTIFIQALIHFKQHDEAEMYAHKFLKKMWDEDLIVAYGLIHATDALNQLAFAEQWLATYPKSAALLCTLGRLSERNKVFGKAKSYYQNAAALSPSKEIYNLLAKLAEQLDDTAAMVSWYRKAADL